MVPRVCEGVEPDEHRGVADAERGAGVHAAQEAAQLSLEFLSWLQTREVLSRAVRGKRKAEGARAYREQVQELARGGGEEGSLERLSGGLAIGSGEFVDLVRGMGAALGARGDAGQPGLRGGRDGDPAAGERLEKERELKQALRKAEKSLHVEMSPL